MKSLFNNISIVHYVLKQFYDALLCGARINTSFLAMINLQFLGKDGGNLKFLFVVLSDTSLHKTFL